MLKKIAEIEKIQFFDETIPRTINKKVGSIDPIIKNKPNLELFPIIDGDTNNLKLFGKRRSEIENQIIYIYIKDSKKKQNFLKGRIIYCYYTFFIVKCMEMDELVTLDYLYSEIHSENIRYKDSIGLIYEEV